jgi:hypothetical protein
MVDILELLQAMKIADKPRVDMEEHLYGKPKKQLTEQERKRKFIRQMVKGGKRR